MRQLLGIVLFITGAHGLCSIYHRVDSDIWFIPTCFGFLLGAGCGLICLDYLDFSLGGSNRLALPKVTPMKPIQTGFTYEPLKPDTPLSGPCPKPPMVTGVSEPENPRPWKRPTEQHLKHLRIDK